MSSPGRTRVPSRTRPDPALVEQVHRAIRSVNQTFAARLRASLRREGVPFSRFVVLRLLVGRGPTTSKALAGTLGVTTANMPGLIDRLEADGLVTRTRNPRDRREILVEATPKGRRTCLRLRDTAVRQLLRAFEGWSEADLRALLRSLQRLGPPRRPEGLTELPIVRSARTGVPAVASRPR